MQAQNDKNIKQKRLTKIINKNIKSKSFCGMIRVTVSIVCLWGGH